MEQCWKIMNIDKGVTYESWENLGNLLFHLPRGLDRSLRAFKLRDRETMLLPFKPGEVFREGDEERPTLRFPKAATQSTRNPTALLSLPVELIHAVYSELNLQPANVANVVCLSVTCQTLWAIGSDYIYRHIAARAALHSWAGDRVLCVGDYLLLEDIPDGLLTPQEQDEFLVDEDVQESLYEYPFEEISPNGLQEDEVCGDADLHERIGSDKTHVLFKELCNLDSPPSALPSPVVLRNLSRMQFVRESALLALKAKHAASGGALSLKLAHVGLGELLMTRICLSSSPSPSLRWNGPIHRGIWAGHRFDVVDEEEFLQEVIGGTWTDVSSEVLRDLEAIWTAEYPS
ncbi:hypothetical protein C8R46DRAFT_1101854 [Mycena filopes]|nr:hypothetical protein C8R46DRAFT_1101854 [Mycena filopes]